MSDDKRRIDVFISSTSIDLPAYRAVVRDAILELAFFPNGMESWPVAGEDPVDLCKNQVEASEIYLGIFAHRYGWRPDGYDGKSITELEYDWAGEVKRNGKPIPRLCFIMKDDFPWPKDKMEIDAEDDLRRFKARVKAKHAGFFTTPEDLKAQVAVALANIKAKMIHERTIRWAAGEHFDTYTLRRPLGEGGNGQVWLVDETLPDGSQREVAIKVLKSEIARNPVRVERFKREISIMARINYRHIVPVYAYGTSELYVVMPYLKGGTLRAKMTGKPLTPEKAMTWLDQIGAALDYVHDRYPGLIHRDVKPENMLLAEDGETLYLADFGLVLSSDGPDERLTDEGKPVGTGRYMAPEQWRNRTLSRHTDLYALGILAYELLTGHLPFQYDNDLDLGNAHCDADLPEDTNLTNPMLRILQKAAAKVPEERYPTARAFLTDLRNWEEDPGNFDPRVEDYLDWLISDVEDRVTQQFVELEGEKTRLEVAPTHKRRRKHYIDDDLFESRTTTVYADHIEAFSQGKQFVQNVRQHLTNLDRAALLGEPGSGKSYMLLRLTIDYARMWLAAADKASALIPVLLYLNEYDGGPFVDFVKEALDTLAPYHDRLLREKRLVLLCDALNEMPRKDGQMQSLIDYLKNAPYFIVSCRVRDYRDDLNALKPLEQVLLHDLELPAIRQLVHKRLPDDLGASLWAAMGGSDGLMAFWQEVQDAEVGNNFWDASTKWWEVRNFYGAPQDWYRMHSGARLIPLARNPYMGDLLCRTYGKNETLPDSRAALFGQFITQMLAREANAAARRGEILPAATEIQEAMVKLAHVLQASSLTVIRHQDAVKALSQPDADDLLKAATDANILSLADGEYKFAHQLLQEYFAARILLELMTNDETEGTHQRARALFAPDWWEAGAWRETTVILGEFLGDGADGPNRVAGWLASATPEVALQVITRNAAGLTLDDVYAETRASLVRSARNHAEEHDPLGRAAAYRVLGLLNADERAGIGLRPDGLPDIIWCDVPAPESGTFTMGSDKEHDLQADDHESPQHQAAVETFQMAQYQVTYAQYRAFVEAEDGFADDRWWHDFPEAYKQQELLDQTFPYANHPREPVSWYQALAFCRWLTVKYREAGIMGEDEQITLPTETQWEYAARGPKGLAYPYGDEFDAGKANVDETGIGQTSAVGMFPDGASWCSVLDLSGNVWEWCLSKWRSDYNAPESNIIDNSNSRRVLRGGSWFLIHNLARAAYRSLDNPDLRYDLNGFRLVRAPS